jgi:hypothetical protein
MEMGSPEGRRLASRGVPAKEPGPGLTMAIIEIAHSSPDRGCTVGMVEGEEAGLPEHRAPEQGAGRWSGSPSGVTRTSDVFNRKRSVMLAGPCDRELTCGLMQPALVVDGKTIPAAKSSESAPTKRRADNPGATRFIRPRERHKATLSRKPESRMRSTRENLATLNEKKITIRERTDQVARSRASRDFRVITP